MRRRIRIRPRFYLLLICMLLIFFGLSCGLNLLELCRQEKRVALLQEKRNALAQQLQALEGELAYARTDAYVEHIARSELNLIYPGEIRYIAG